MCKRPSLCITARTLFQGGRSDPAIDPLTATSTWRCFYLCQLSPAGSHFQRIVESTSSNRQHGILEAPTRHAPKSLPNATRMRYIRQCDDYGKSRVRNLQEVNSRIVAVGQYICLRCRHQPICHVIFTSTFSVLNLGHPPCNEQRSAKLTSFFWSHNVCAEMSGSACSAQVIYRPKMHVRK